MVLNLDSYEIGSGCQGSYWNSLQRGRDQSFGGFQAHFVGEYSFAKAKLLPSSFSVFFVETNGMKNRKLARNSKHCRLPRPFHTRVFLDWHNGP